MPAVESLESTVGTGTEKKEPTVGVWIVFKRTLPNKQANIKKVMLAKKTMTNRTSNWLNDNWDLFNFFFIWVAIGILLFVIITR